MGTTCPCPRLDRYALLLAPLRFANSALHLGPSFLGLNGSLHRHHDGNTTLHTQRLVLWFQVLTRVENLHGIIVQLPLPEVVDSRSALQAVEFEEHADGLSSQLNGDILTVEADSLILQDNGGRTFHGTLHSELINAELTSNP